MTIHWPHARRTLLLLWLIAAPGCGPGGQHVEPPAPAPREPMGETSEPADAAARTEPSTATSPGEGVDSLPAPAPPLAEEELEEGDPETRKRADEASGRVREAIEGTRRSHEDVPGRE